MRGPVQWLLIGGPAHGKLLWIKAGAQLRYPHTDSEEYLYVAENFAHRGKQYRLGVCTSAGGARYSADMMATLIELSHVQPLDGGVDHAHQA